MEDNESVRAEFMDIVRSIIKRPGMYGVYKVEDIHFLFLGAKLLHDDTISGILRNFENGFRQFVNKYYDCVQGQGHEWHRLIRFHCGDNGFAQIERFGALFEAYINNRPQDVMPVED